MDYTIGDALVVLERGHLVRLSLWAIGSVVVGGLAVLLASRARPAQESFWRHFGIQSGAWGLVDLVIVVAAWNGIVPRDLAGAIALDRFLWLNIGLDVGYMMLGATLLAFGLRAPRRHGLIGAGVAIVAQGAALAILDAQLSAYIVR
jgi:hypothetical protein